MFDQANTYFSSKSKIVWLNSFIILIFFLLTIYVKLWGHGSLITDLFASPYNLIHPYYGAFTMVANVLLCVTMSVCLFSTVMLRKLHPQAKINGFLASFGTIIGFIAIDRMFRLTTIMKDYVAHPLKVLMLVIYGVAVLSCCIIYRRKLLTTPFWLLLCSAAMLVFGAVIDLIPMGGVGTPAMLEEGPTLLAALNITAYFWIVCQRELSKACKRYGHMFNSQFQS